MQIGSKSYGQTLEVVVEKKYKEVVVWFTTVLGLWLFKLCPPFFFWYGHVVEPS
jgi:hypothetical protein